MAEPVKSSICIVPLIGLPASGKTFFSNKLKDHLEKKGVSCLHVCYDALVPLPVQKELSLEPGRWKREREMILRAVDMIVSGEEGGGEENKHYEALSRSVAVGRRLVVLVDDNNYLQSMRYEYYQLARTYTAGFAQLYFSCDEQTSLKLNQDRAEEERVPSTVIQNIQSKLEPPNPLANKWESFSFTLPHTEDTQHNLEMVETVIEAALSSPVTLEVSGPSEEERHLDRIVCSASVVHQADKHLRSLVNKKMVSMKQSGLGKEEMNVKSKSIYSIKTEVLEDLKTGWTKLDKDLVRSVENRDSESGVRLEKEMEELFESKLQLKT